MAKKPISVKLPKEMLADIDGECEGLGCNRTDFIIDAVQEKLQGKAENQNTKQDNEEPKEEPKEKQKVVINLDDTPKAESIPKATIEIKPEQVDNSNKPTVEMISFNSQLLPFAKRYNI